MEWNRLRTFYHVATCRSFTKAAGVLNSSQPALSASIALLEHQLKTTLFVRTPTGVTLTRNGAKLYDVVKPIFITLEQIKDDLVEENQSPKGELVVSATNGVVNFFLTPFLPDFSKKYPDIFLKVFAQDEVPIFDFGHADLAICPFLENRKDLIQKHLLTNNVVLYASPSYLKEFGEPKTPKDLNQHRLIGVGGFSPCFDNMNWHLRLGMDDESERVPYMVVTPPASRLFLAEQGVGIIAISAEHPGLDQMNLVRVLPKIKGPIVESYLIYPEHLKDSKKIKAFEDFMLPLFKEHYGR